jgi:hypothetical protein
MHACLSDDKTCESHADKHQRFLPKQIGFSRILPEKAWQANVILSRARISVSHLGMMASGMAYLASNHEGY